MYLPKSKYSKPLYTRGGEYLLPNGREYVGWYFETYKGEAYSGKTPSRYSQKIFNSKKSDTNVDIRFVNDLIIPTLKEIEQGFFTRYYIQDRRNRNIIEVKKQKYLVLSKRNYLKGVKLLWNLSKPADDIKQGPYIYFGSASKNKETVIEAEKQMPGLSSTIKSYSEFVK